MIEVNLVPDVKKELIKAQQVRTLVISIAILAVIVSVTITVLLGLYVFGAQTLLLGNAEKKITEQSDTLKKVEDLPKILTLQNQVKKISESHSSKGATSRIFELLQATNPGYPNNIAVSTATLDTEAGQIKIEAQALGGYRSLETYIKTLQQTKLKYKPADKTDKELEDEGSIMVATQKNETCFKDQDQHRADVMCTQPDEKCFTESQHSIYEKCLASDYQPDGIGYGRDTTGRKVLSFTMTFTYVSELFDVNSRDVKIGNLKYENVTDSYVDIPESLFTTKATPIEENK